MRLGLTFDPLRDRSVGGEKKRGSGERLGPGGAAKAGMKWGQVAEKVSVKAGGGRGGAGGRGGKVAEETGGGWGRLLAFHSPMVLRQ